MIASPVLALTLALGSLAPLAQASPAPASSPAPLATPAADASPLGSAPPAAPSESPSPAPPATATPTATPKAAPVAPATPGAYKYRFVPHLPSEPRPGQPLITAVYLNDAHLHSKGMISIKVETNEAVIKVVSRSNGREGAIPQVRPGDFEANSRLPALPFIASGVTIELEFVATSADGRKTTVRVPVKLD